MAIEKEKFFEIIRNVSESEGLNKDNLLEKIKGELRNKDYEEYSKFNLNFSKDYQFGIKTSEETAEDWTLLHLAAECNNLLIVKLLLGKKADVNIRVKDGSSDGPTALHIAALHGHQEIVQLLLDNNANPLLKDSQGRTPIDVVGNAENKETIVKMLEEAKQNYSPKKAKDLNIKLQDGSTYHLSQDSHRTPAKTVKKRSSVTAALENGNKRTSLNSTDESSDSIVNEQYPSVKDRIKNIESPEKINATCSSNQTPAIESDGDDSGLELETTLSTSSRSEINHDGANHVEENVDNQTLKNALRSQKEKNQSLKQKIQELESKNATLNSELEKTKTKTDEVSLKEAQKELAELRNCVTGHGTRLEALNKLDKENQSLKQQIQDLESENTTFKGELGKTKTKTNEVSLEKIGKRQFSPKVAYASLAAMLAVGAALSIASGLFVLSIIATSVTSALIAGGITYTMSKPTTELKEVDIQGSVQHGIAKVT